MPVLAFLVGVAYFPGIPSAASMPRWWVLALGLPLASRLDLRALGPFALTLLAATLAWAFAASFFGSPHPHAAALEWDFLALLCLVAVAAAGLDDLGPTIEALAWGVAASALLCVPQALGWSPVPLSGGKAAGLFINSEVMAETAAPLVAWAASSRRWPLAAVLALPLALCGSRLAPAAAAAGLLWAWRPRRAWVRPALVLTLAAAAAASLVLLKVESGGQRVVLWVAAAYSITPLGRGLGWWAAAHPGPFEEFVHSDLLQAMVELGAGAAPLAAFFAAALWRTTDAGPRAALAAAYLEAVVSFPLHVPCAGFLVFALAGYALRRRARVRGAGPRGGADARARYGRAGAHCGGVDRGVGRGRSALPL